MPAAPTEFDLPIYQDAMRYDAEHWWKTDDLIFWREMAEEYGPRVLELAAGTGRLGLHVLQTQATYTGVEISQGFLRRARSKLGPFGQRVHLIQGDIRQLHLGETFDLIFIGFNSFMHLITDEDALATLGCVREHCHAATRFIIDLFVPEPLILARPADHRIQAMVYPDPETGATITVEETNDYDPVTELNKVRWYYSTSRERDFLEYDFTVRIYHPDTMDRLIHDAGLRVVEKWGDYQRSAFGPESTLQIYVAQLGS